MGLILNYGNIRFYFMSVLITHEKRVCALDRFASAVGLRMNCTAVFMSLLVSITIWQHRIKLGPIRKSISIRCIVIMVFDKAVKNRGVMHQVFGSQVACKVLELFSPRIWTGFSRDILAECWHCTGTGIATYLSYIIRARKSLKYLKEYFLQWEYIMISYCIYITYSSCEWYIKPDRLEVKIASIMTWWVWTHHSWIKA